MNLEELESVMKLMTKHQINEVTLEDGTTIKKSVHLPKAKKPSIAPSVKTEQGFPPGVAELINATPGIGAPNSNSFNRFSISNVMPNFDKE
jgi:hypothetical protein